MELFCPIKSEAWKTRPGLLGVIEQVNRAAKYIPLESEAEKHGTLYLEVSKTNSEIQPILNRYTDFISSRVRSDNDNYYITTSYQVIKQCQWDEDLKYFVKGTPKADQRHTILLLSDFETALKLKGIPYLEVSVGKITDPNQFCLPLGSDRDKISEILNKYENIDLAFSRLCTAYSNGHNLNPEEWWLLANVASRKAYKSLIQNNTDMATSILPLGTGVYSVITAFENDWARFFLQYFFEQSHSVINLAEQALNIMNTFEEAQWNYPLNKAYEDYNG